VTKSSLSRQQQKKVSHAHYRIADTAKAAAHEHWDVLAMDNEFYDRWVKAYPDKTAKQLEDRFVELNWGKYIPFARATLASLLATPIDEELKREIHEALVLDNTLVAGRKNPHTVIGSVH
jgi:hypothetical protein